MSVLAYHEITPVGLSGYGVSINQFDQHLELIARREAAVNNRVLVTFDDGEKSQYECALPILQKHRIKAFFFVNVGMIGRTAAIQGWHQTFMDWPALKELVRLGHRVQSHGWSHKYLTSCSDAELKRELEMSRKGLEERLGVGVDSLSFPGGRWNSRVLRSCSEVGYTRVFTSDPWISAMERDGVIAQGRFMVRRSTDLKALETMLGANGAHLFRLRMEGKLKSAARGLIGEKVYHTVWKTLISRESTYSEP